MTDRPDYDDDSDAYDLRGLTLTVNGEPVPLPEMVIVGREYEIAGPVGTLCFSITKRSAP